MDSFALRPGRRLGSVLVAIAVAGAVGGALTVSAQSTPVTLKVWGSPSWTQAQKDVLESFKATTGIGVDLELPKDRPTVLAKWNAGERPDIMFYFADAAIIVSLNPEENLQDLSNEPFVARTLPNVVDGLRFNGKLYAALWEYPYLFGVVYNQPLFEELGLQPPRNFDDVLTLCSAIQAARPDVAPVFSGGGDAWPLQMIVISMWLDRQESEGLIDGLNTGTAKFTDEAFVQGAEKVKQLVDGGCYNKDLLTATFEQELSAIPDGKAAMVFANTYHTNSAIEVLGADRIDETEGFVGISETSNAVGWQASGGIEAPRTGDEAREAAARQFIDFYLGDGYKPFIDAQKSFSVLSTVEAPSDVPQILQEANAGFVAHGIPIFSQKLQADYGDFPSAVQAIAAGTATPQDAMQSLQDALESSAKLLGLPGY